MKAVEAFIVTLTFLMSVSDADADGLGAGCGTDVSVCPFLVALVFCLCGVLVLLTGLSMLLVLTEPLAGVFGIADTAHNGADISVDAVDILMLMVAFLMMLLMLPAVMRTLVVFILVVKASLILVLVR